MVLENSRTNRQDQEPDARMRRLVEANIVGVFIANRDGRVVEANDAFLAMVGYTREDLTDGQIRWTELTPPEWEAVSQAAIEQIGTTGRCDVFEKEYFRKDGSRVPVLVAGAAMSQTEAVSFVLDLTERKRAEDVLRESETRFRTLWDQATDAFFLIDEASTVVDVNRQACDSLGYSREELIGRRPRDFDAGLDDASIAQVAERVGAGETVTFETLHRRKDGTVFPVEIRARQFPQGARRFRLSLVRDVTDRKRAEAALRESEQRYRTLFEKANDAVFLENERDEIIEVNQRTCALLGYSRDELLTMKVSDLQAPEVRHQAGSVIRGEMERHGSTPFEAVDLHRSGRRVAVEVTNTPIVHQGQKLVLSIVRDITDRKRTEAELRASEERFRTLVQFSFDVYWETDAEHRFTRLEFAERFPDSPPPGSEVGKTPWEVGHFEQDEAVWQKLRATLDAHLPFRDVELARATPDGGKRYLSASGLPVFDATGHFLGYRGVAREITDRKRAEQVVRNTAAQWQATFDAVQDMVLLLDKDCRILRANHAAAEFLGLPFDKIVGGHCYGLMHGTSTPPTECPLAKMRQSGRHEEAEVLARKGGPLLLVSADPLFDPSGELTQVVHVARDITEHKRAEEALRQSEAYLAEAQRLSHTGSWAFDVASDTYVYVSEECVRIFEIDAREDSPTREAVARLIQPEDWPRVNEAFERTVHDQVDTSSEFRITLPSGTVKHVHAIRHPVLNDAGEVVKVVGTVIDITDRKRAENELRASDAQLARERDRLRLLLEINNLIVSKLDVNELFRAVSQCMRKHFAHDCTTFWLINERSVSLERKFFDFPTGRGFLEKVEVARPSNLEGEWWRVRTPVFYSPPQTDIPLPVREATRAESLISAVSLPLIGTNGPLGLLNLSSRKADAFSEADADLLAQIGTQVSLVLDNALAYEGLRASRDALRRSETYLAEAQRLTHTGSWVRHNTGDIVYLSDELYRIFGLDPEQGLPSRETLRRQVHPDDVERAVASVENALRDKVDTFVEYRIVLPDGTVKHLQVIRHPVLDDAGDVVELVGTALDVTDRKRDEEALRQSEAYLAESQRLSHTGSWALDVASNKNIYVSEECFRIFGFDPLPTGEAILQLIHPEDRDTWRRNLDKALHEKIDTFGEYRTVLPDGTVKHLHVIWHPVLDTNGGLSQIIGTAADVTERVRNEEALRRSETYLSETQKLSHTGSWVWDPIYRTFLYASEEMLRLYGFDPHQGIPTPDRVLERIHPDDRDKIKHTRTGTADVDFDYRFVLPDGTLKYFHCIAHPMVGPSGEVHEVLGIAMDITDRKRAEAALREGETRFRTFVDHAADAFFMLDCEQGTIIDVNQAACESLGYTRPELLGMTPMAFHLDSERAQMESVAARAAAGETVVDTHWHRRKDGARFPVEVHTSLVSYGGRRFLLKVARDISDRVRAEEQRDRLRELEADLAHINRVSMMGELTASIAHEVNQPLAGVVSNAGASLRWLAGDPPNLERAREAILRIGRDGKRAGEIIARIRALTRRAATPQGKLDPNQTIQDVLALVRDEATRNRVIIRTQFADDLAPVAGDRVQLQQVALNLVMNAIEAMSGVGGRARELVITTQNVDPNQVQVSVEDAGTGLDPNAMDKIFDSFYTTKPGGMGMGLSISRSIIEAHGGRLWATAKDGPGTMFHFTLPTYHEDESHA